MTVQNQYYVYMLECADRSFYTGITTDLQKRLQKHNGLLPGGARYTQIRRPVVLRYCKRFPNRKTALRQEYALKQLSHKEKKQLCDQTTCLLTRMGKEEIIFV